MENDAGVSKLLELAFGKKPTMPEEMAAHSSIPSNVLNEDFMKKFEDVLRMQLFITYDKWSNYFERFYRDMLSSHSMYLCRVMYVCLFEHKYNRNIFDSFISVFILVGKINKDTLKKVGIDFRGLNSDIIMIFYRNILKNSFPQSGGFYGFVEYIRRHKNLDWNWDENDLALLYDDSVSVNFKKDMQETLKKEYHNYRPSAEITPGMKIAMSTTAQCMALEVLSTTTRSTDLPPLLSEHELIKRLVEYRKRELTTNAEKNGMEATSTFETSHGNSSSNSNSKPNCFVAHQEDIEWHESIVQAVMRHNHSNFSHHENTQNPKLVEAERTFDHLKTLIKSLIEVLDECNKE